MVSDSRPQPPVIESRNLGLAVHGVEILRSIDLAIGHGEVVGLLGPNGAGKTTLLRCLAGEVDGYTGELLVFGRPLREWRPGDLARRRAVMPQYQTVPFPFSAGKIVAMGRYPHDEDGTSAAGRGIVADAMRRTTVTHLKDKRYDRLSGGEAQRVQMARALAQVLEPPYDGKFLQFDEPTSSLDPKYQHQALRRIRELAEAGLTSICVLHDLNLAATYCDRIILMRQGRIHVAGAAAAVLTAPHVKDVFDIEVDVIHHPRKTGPVIVPLTSGG